MGNLSRALLAIGLTFASVCRADPPAPAQPQSELPPVPASEESWRDEPDQSAAQLHPAQQGRYELIGYEALAGGLVAGEALQRLTGLSDSLVLVLAGTGAGLAAGILTLALTPPDFPAPRAQLAASGALWGGIVPWLVLTAWGGLDDAAWSALLVGAVAGDAAGLALGYFFNPPTGEVSLVNSGAAWGLVLSVLTATVAGVPASTHALIGLIAGGVGATAAGVLGNFIRPARELILAYDFITAIGLGLGAAIADLDWEARNPVAPLTPQSHDRAFKVAAGGIIGAAVGLTATVVLHAFTDTFDRLEDRVSVAPWGGRDSAGIVAMASW